MKRLLTCVWLLTFAYAALGTSASAQTPAPIVTEAQMLAALGAEFTPAYRDLAQEAAALRSAVDALCSERPSTSKLADARVAWLATARTWRFVEAWPIGPMLERRSLPRFDFWPTRSQQIDAAVAQHAGGAALALDTIGFSAQGLPALEYLLFSAQANKPPIIASDSHCSYARRLAESFAAEADALSAAWGEWTARWSQPDAPASAALGDALNVLIGALERLRTRKLVKPAAAAKSATPACDAWRSGATREHLLATMQGIERVLRGGNSKRGLLALLRGRGHLALAVRIETELERATSQLRGLPAQVPAAKRGAINGAVQAIGRLQSTLSGEVAEVLRVSVGFNETDGD